MNTLKRNIFCAMLTFLISPNILQAWEVERLDQIIDRVSNTYGVERVNKSKTIRLEEDVRIAYEDHHYSPEFNQFIHGRREFVFNLKEQKGSAEYYSNFTGNSYHARILEIDEGYVTIDYGNSTYIPEPDSNFHTEFGYVYRGSDTLLAHMLLKNRKTAEYLGKVSWLGKIHDLVAFDFPNSPPLKLYIESNTGFISKMVRIVPQGDENLTVSYTFSAHMKKEGILFAQEHTVFIGQDLLQISLNRNIVLNAKADKDAFKLDEGIVKEPERLSTTKMTVEKISQRIQYVGQGEAYTAFIDMGDYLIGLGANAGFGERLEAYRSKTKSDKPLHYLLVTDHHETESIGAIDAVSELTTLIATPGAKNNLERLLAESKLTPQIKFVDEEFQIDGVKFINISTGHAEHVLVAYIADDNVLYQSDHYINPYADQVFYTKNSAVTLYNSLKDKNLNIEILLSSGSRRLESWANFEMAIKAHKPNFCQPKRAICTNSL